MHEFSPLDVILTHAYFKPSLQCIGNTAWITFFFILDAFHTQCNQSSGVLQDSVTLRNENKLFVIGLFGVTLEDMIGGRHWYISVKLQSHLLASGISSQLLHLQGRRVHKISKYFTAFYSIRPYFHYARTTPVTYMAEWYLLGRQFVGEPWTLQYVLAWLRVISPLLSCMPTWT